MSFTTAEGRDRILEDTAAAAFRLNGALAEVGEAYEHLDEQTGDRVEAALFRPLQQAYGQLKRTHSEFAQRFGLQARNFETPSETAPHDVRTALEHAADRVQEADDILSELQDTLLPVEVGDQELRAGLSSVRTVISPLPAECDRLISHFGR